MDQERHKRKKEIRRALAFIESPLAFPDPDSGMSMVSQLLVNLLVEGNALFKEELCEGAVKEFSEGLGVVRYAETQDICVPEALVESLYVNRATVYYSMKEFERGMQDCEQALEVNKGSSKALFRKALCLQELGRLREAYDCTTDCLLVSRLDIQVNELAQQLATRLGLKNRKAYVPATQGGGLGNGLGPSHVPGSSRPKSPLAATPPASATPTPPALATPPASATAQEADLDVMGEDLDCLLDRLPREPGAAEGFTEFFQTGIQAGFPPPTRAPPTSSSPLKAPGGHAQRPAPGRLPPPSGACLPPAFFGSPLSKLGVMETTPPPGLGGRGGGRGLGPGAPSLDSLDSLDSLGPAPRAGRGVAGGRVRGQAGPAVKEPLHTLDPLNRTHSREIRDLLKSRDQLDTLNTLDQLDTLNTLDQLDTLNTLDQLDTLNTLDQLDTLNTLDQLDALNTLDQLDALNTLDQLSTLNTLDQLDTLNTLDQLDTLNTLDQLSTLDTLDQLSTLDTLDQLSTLDTLDQLGSLDQLDILEPQDRREPLDDLMTVQGQGDVLSPAYDDAEDACLDGSLDQVLDSLQGASTQELPGGGDDPKAVGNLNSLDALDSFSTTEEDLHKPGIKSSQHATPAPSPPKKDKQRNKASNPLDCTHMFLQACSLCFPRQARSVYSYVHKPHVVHQCQKDLLLCRRRSDPEPAWTRVRPIPMNTKPFTGKFVLCRELLSSGEVGLCKFGEMCTFAFNQLEIDVWTEEKRGALDRARLFDTPTCSVDPAARVLQLLQENRGTFQFLCAKCFDGKPSIISKRCRDDGVTCSNPSARHPFEANKCLAYATGPRSTSYRKLRPVSSARSLDLCHHEARYGCSLGGRCLFAHSPLELRTWTLQRDSGITEEEIVEKSLQYYGERELDHAPAFSKGKSVNGVKAQAPSTWGVGGGAAREQTGGGRGGGGAAPRLNLRLKFICGLCWGNGLITEADQALKYCTAKGRHSWTKEGRVLLVKSPERNKWVQVRQLPCKNYPAQYDICGQILRNRKCNYIGNCSFAHSQEEKELWTYMKDNDLRDVEQIYYVWLDVARKGGQSKGGAAATAAATTSGDDKNIVMPTDFAEPTSGFYCRFCGRQSNGERQWQQHITTEKHKDRLFGSEGEDHSLTWAHRFPGLRLELCPRWDGECAEGVCCDYAHSPEELKEWVERRAHLRRKLAQAREEMLILPGDFQFGKFNFLLHD